VNDLILYRPDGTPTTLGAYHDRDYLLVVFFRHLLCIACNSHLGTVLVARQELAARRCSILIVTQAKPEVLAKHLGLRQYPVAFAADPERAVYKAFGLGRARVLSFFRPDVLLRYLFGMFRGYAPWMPYEGEDILQLGGDFILDRAGNVVFSYRSSVATDRPSAKTILAAVPSPPPMAGTAPPDTRHVDSPAGGA
jgi:peroxiredoxin